MDFIDKNIQAYAENHTDSEPKHLYDLNRFTHTNLLMPRMLSGHLQGRYLSMISQLMQATSILDIGTYSGYSALCLAEGLQKDGCLYTIDSNEEVLEVAKEFISNSPYKNKIKVIHGNAISEIEKLNELIDFWDIVWMDADKGGYITYYNLCIDKMRPGGLIMADNVLWSGKVLSEQERLNDKDTEALHAFNEMVQNDSRVDNLLLPIRDGIMMVRKK